MSYLKPSLARLPPPRPVASLRIDSGIIAWRHAITDGPSGRARTFFLHYSKDARMTITGRGPRPQLLSRARFPVHEMDCFLNSEAFFLKP